MDADTDKCTSCALGAAYEASFNRMGGDETENEYASLEELYPVLDEVIALGGEHELPITVEDKIISLNDDDRWPREKIALEFVKPIEEAMEENAG